MSDIYREPLVVYHRNLRRQNRTMESTQCKIKRFFVWGADFRVYVDTYQEAYDLVSKAEEKGRILTVEPVYSL